MAFGFDKKLGFGCMRLPMLENGLVDEKEFTKMVDLFLEEGFTYFDTAHVYLNGESERALKHCLTSRYPRDKYFLTNKLSNIFNTEEEIRPLFNLQLEECGVDYFDFYLMHAQNAAIFEKYKKLHAYEIAFELKKEGKIKHVGISFHDSPEVLDKILTEYPELECVQIQFNYLDYKDSYVRSDECLEICIKHNKPVIVMEPVRGGALVNLPDDGKKLLDDFNNGSYASYAIRFAASFDPIFMVLSGMSNMEQMEDNVSYMKEFKPLNVAEFQTLDKIREMLHSKNEIPCTSCKYCVDGCPKHISIPNVFACLNAFKSRGDRSAGWYYLLHTESPHSKASECIKCGKCERSCPQKLPIRDLLVEVAKTFEEKTE